MDQDNQLLWNGGTTIRADGNNFLSEVAAAAIIVKACPTGLPLTIRMDSKAAIGASTKDWSLNEKEFVLLVEHGLTCVAMIS